MVSPREELQLREELQGGVSARRELEIRELLQRQAPVEGAAERLSSPNQTFTPSFGVEANLPLQMSGPGEFTAPQQITPSEEIEQFILSARMRQGRPRQARSPSELETMRRIRLASNAALFGFAGELGSEFAQLTLDLSDEEAQQLEELMDREIAQFREESPGQTIPAEMASAAAAAPGGLVAGTVQAARTLPQLIGRGALGGAAAGGLTGAGEAAGGLEERGIGAAQGAAAGAALGATIPLATAGIASGFRALVNRLPGSVQRNAANRVVRALESDEITVGQARQQLDDLGVEGVLADVGEESRRLARGAAAQPGPASAAATRVFRDRQERQGTRILQEIEDSLPAQTSFQGTVDDLISQRASAAGPLYAQAYAVDIPFNDELQRLFDRPAIKRAWTRAQQIAANEDIQLPQIFLSDEAGNLTLNTRVAPNMQTIDFIKRGLDDIIERAREPLTGKIQGDLARSVNATRRELLSVVDDLNPTYAQARAAFAGPSGSLEALSLGRRFARGDPEILERQLSRLTPNDQAFFRAGVAQGLRDIVLRTPDGANAARRLIGNELARQRLRAVFPDDESYEQFLRQMIRETTFFDTGSRVLGGSPTARINEETSQLADPLAGAAIDVATGQPGTGVAAGVVRRLLGRGRQPNPAVVAEVGRMLTAQGDDLASVLSRLQRTESGRGGQALVNALLTGGAATQPPR